MEVKSERAGRDSAQTGEEMSNSHNDWVLWEGGLQDPVPGVFTPPPPYIRAICYSRAVCS